MKSFAVMLGDFSYDDEYSSDKGAQLIFLVLGLVVIVIFLNIMIALVTEAYLNCQETQETVFGKARLQYTSERLALQKALEPRIRKSPLDFEWWGAVVFRTLVFGSIFVTSTFVLILLNFRVFLNMDIQSYGLVEEVDGLDRRIYSVLWSVLSFILTVSIFTLAYNVFKTFSSRGKEVDEYLQKLLRNYPSTAFLFVVDAIGLTPDKSDITIPENELNAYFEEIEDAIQASENKIMGAMSDMEQRLAVK